MYILGISAFYHDSAVALLKDGKLVAAVQEERFTRKKHDASFPLKAIEYCFSQAGITAKDLSCVAYYEKPFLKFERLLQTYLAFAPKGFTSYMRAMPVWLKEKLWMKEYLRRELGCSCPIIFPEHHEAHAASAFFPSPFADAAVLTMDGVGEWATTSYGIGSGNNLELLAEIDFPHSLGLLYSAFTYYAGFKVNSGEYKLMGLAPYGNPIYSDTIKEHLIDIRPDGSFRLDMSYFNYATGLTMTSAKFDALFNGPPRTPESPITQKDMDLAASIQQVTEEVVVAMARTVREKTGKSKLCLAGGVALNCVANGKLLREKIFDEIWIQPASGDAGGAVGAALIAWHLYFGKPRSVQLPDSMEGAYLGPEFSDDDIRKDLENAGAVFTRLDDGEIIRQTAEALSDGKVIGWFQGRMEFGPRALGNRSILGDPRSPKMQSVMNLKIKFRESFRPFAPAVLEERVTDYFQLDIPSPYMLLVAEVAEKRKLAMKDDGSFGIEKLKQLRSDIPAITHVDYSARIQTVNSKTNPRFHSLISEFERRTGCGVVVNTSFNVRGEPIVCTPQDAFRCFMRTGMDILVVGNYLMVKEKQTAANDGSDWQNEFTLD